MTHSISPIIAATDIPLGTTAVVLDARSGPTAYERYSESHLLGAIHVDLDTLLTEKPTDPAYGGRHPLPRVEDFAVSLGKLGITQDTPVIVYDDKNGANAAARLWWMLAAIGHSPVQLVDGGLEAIRKSGLPMSAEVPTVQASRPYPVLTWTLPIASLEDVIKASGQGDKLIIDVREGYRYRGESEPIDLVAGHIPGAVNIPYLNNLTDDGTFCSPDVLASEFKKVMEGYQPADIIVHCGSGVTACHTLLAMEHAGIKGANLYVGSWSEWSRRDLPMAKDT